MGNTIDLYVPPFEIVQLKQLLTFNNKDLRMGEGMVNSENSEGKQQLTLYLTNI
ncbi:hypothetical protein [Vibrio phage vB_VibM_83AMN]|nr:hypothetical protein [Vibrio phage vB_VibM_83AMN]